MGKGQKSYFLTVDERRELKGQGITRPGRHIRKGKTVGRILKEETAVMSVRIAQSSLRRFKNFIDQPLGPSVESALSLYIAFQGIRATEVRIACSINSYEKNKGLLSQFKRRRRRGAIGNKSNAYAHDSAHVDIGKHFWVIIITLPRFRGSVVKRVALLQSLIKAADIDINFTSEGDDEGPLETFAIP